MRDEADKLQRFGLIVFDLNPPRAGGGVVVDGHQVCVYVFSGAAASGGGHGRSPASRDIDRVGALVYGCGFAQARGDQKRRRGAAVYDIGFQMRDHAEEGLFSAQQHNEFNRRARLVLDQAVCPERFKYHDLLPLLH
ncbi:hypothetical protein ACIQNT_39370 [Streptomyces luteogriseus]|uniref:hypothetical protein n=1 Tax=Streptomyces luteogriseus TaxID=68233 RepID=UPI00381356AC